MRHLLIIALSFALFYQTRSESIVLPKGRGLHLQALPTECLIVSTHLLQYEGVIGNPPHLNIITDGLTNSFRIESYWPSKEYGPLIIAGPATLEFTPQFGHVIQYDKIPRGAIQSSILRKNSVIKIVVPAMKRVLFFNYFPPSWPTYNKYTKNGETLDMGDGILSGYMDGPIEIDILAPPYWDTQPRQIVSYALLEQGVINNGGASASGTTPLRVEKSTDLKNWLPAALILNQAEPRTFYRLKAE